MVQGSEIPKCGNLGPEKAKIAQVCGENCKFDRWVDGNTEGGPVLEKTPSSMQGSSGVGSHSPAEGRLALERGNLVRCACRRCGPIGQGRPWQLHDGRPMGRDGS